METIYYKTGSGDDGEAFSRAGGIIRSGGLVAFPTETVYGLGGNAYSSESSRKIYAAKGRPQDNPLIVHVARPEDASEFAVVNGAYEKLAAAFMPGPLTVILPKKPNMPDSTTGGLATVAVRCPSHPAARALIEAARCPIAAPSANLSGKPSPTSAAHVARDLDGRIDMIIDGGECEIGLESTVISIDGGTVRILRPGAVTREMLANAGIEASVDEAVCDPAKAGEKPASPGMKYKHYAPDAPLYLVEGGTDELLAEARQAALTPAAVMCRSDEEECFAGFIVLDTGEDEAEFARRLFSLLRRADESGAKSIYAHLPSREGIGLALYNRIIRAAAGKIIKRP